MAHHVSRMRVGFVMEQALGHVTYTQNLRAAYAGADRVTPVWLPIPFESSGPLDRLPIARSNWSIRGSLRAHAAVRGLGGASAFDALLYHTQTISLLAGAAQRRTAVILSLDATPIGFDRIGGAYGHRTAAAGAERLKSLLHKRIFRGAAALTTWSQWAKDSLRDDYGVDPRRVTVIPPGVDLQVFSPGVRRGEDGDRRLRLLFVGGDFERKGGPLLLNCMRAGLAERCELHVITGQPVPETPGVVVHRGLRPNDPRLLQLYRDADIFTLPTAGDCLAVVLAEALASGLPVVTTDVAAQPEAVRDGETGLIVSAGDAKQLGRALLRLIDDPGLRRAMGRAARLDAEARFDARANAARLLDVIEDGIDRWRAARSGSRHGAASPGPDAPRYILTPSE
jgi:glycosyltransferase involved in cell wall biosynthesis